jgi:hypothetical protein
LLLPLAILFAGFAPAAISFAAGQAAFIGRSEVPEPVAWDHAAADTLVDAVRRDLRGEDGQASTWTTAPCGFAKNSPLSKSMSFPAA